MYAVVRLNSFDPVKLADSTSLEQFDQIHRAQPGYVGTVVVDLQAGRRLALNLWESEEHSAAALSVVGPEVGRLLNRSCLDRLSSSAQEPYFPQIWSGLLIRRTGGRGGPSC